jgi:hypothetical protein
MANISTILAGVAFVTLAATNVVVMLEASQPSRSAATRNRLIAAHRGTVQMDVEDGLTVEQKNAGVLPCVSRATGTVVLSA